MSIRKSLTVQNAIPTSVQPAPRGLETLSLPCAHQTRLLGLNRGVTPRQGPWESARATVSPPVFLGAGVRSTHGAAGSVSARRPHRVAQHGLGSRSQQPPEPPASSLETALGGAEAILSFPLPAHSPQTGRSHYTPRCVHFCTSTARQAQPQGKLPAGAAQQP